MARHLQLMVFVDHVLKVRALDPASMEHVESCAYCRSDLRWLEQLVALRNLEPPKPAVETAFEIFRKNRDAA